MLKLLRKKGLMKRLLWVVAVVIIISFGFFGTATVMDDMSQQAAGKIFGRKIPLDEFQKSLNHAQIQAILSYGDNFFKIRQFLNLEAEAWDRLILLHEAKKRRLKASNEEVVQTIQQYPFFHRDGRFDPYLYKEIVRYVFKIKPRDFEESVRESLLFNKLYEQTTGKINVTEEEVREEYKKANEKIQVDYVLFPAEEENNNVTLSEQEILSHYESHKDEFRVPLTVNVQYLHLPYPVEAAESVTENTTSSDQNKQKDELTAKANLISMELLLTPDLKEVGAKYDLTAQETGPFSQEQPSFQLGSYELLQKTFEMKPGEISKPIETSQGLYLLKLLDRKESYLPEFAEAAPQVRAVLTAQKAKELAKQKAGEFFEKINASLQNQPEKKFADAAKELNLTVAQTPLFGRGQYLPNIGIASDFEDAAFALNGQDSKISAVTETPKGYALLSLVAYEPMNEEQFQKDKEKFGQTLEKEKKLEAFNDFISGLKLKAKLQDYTAQLKPQPPTEQ